MNDGNHSAKKGADSSAVNSQNIPKSLKFIRPIDPIGPKIWDILKKGLYWVSVIRARTKDWCSFLSPKCIRCKSVKHKSSRPGFTQNGAKIFSKSNLKNHITPVPSKLVDPCSGLCNKWKMGHFLWPSQNIWSVGIWKSWLQFHIDFFSNVRPPLYFSTSKHQIQYSKGSRLKYHSI